MAEKPIPRPYQDTQPYWDAAKEHRLVLQRCQDCSKHQFYPRGVCSHCLSSKLEWVEASGRGIVHTYTVCYRAPHPGFGNDVPYVLAMVELAEGPRMMTNIIGCKPETVRIDMAVKVVFDDVTPEVAVPKFTPA